MSNLPAGASACNAGRSVRRLRIRPPASPPPPTVTPSPATCPSCSCPRVVGGGYAQADAEVDRQARYELIVASRANRLGHEAVAAMEHLIEALTNFREAAVSPELLQQFHRSGLLPHRSGSGMEYGPDYFGQAAEDATAMAWSVQQFLSVLRGELVRHPADPPAKSARHRS